MQDTYSDEYTWVQSLMEIKLYSLTVTELDFCMHQCFKTIIYLTSNIWWWYAYFLSDEQMPGSG